MTIFSKDSLELLRQRIDLIEVLTPFVKFSRQGSSFKALCPFHEEKTPSFIVQRGDSHYHCFGCGAHGDAIAFLMNFQKMSFVQAVEYLADRFQVYLKQEEKNEKYQLSKSYYKKILEDACLFYHFYLLHTQEGHLALSYLYNRGIDLSFIKKFRLGLAPKKNDLLFQMTRKEKIKKEHLIEVGLIKNNGNDFFSDRIMIPIEDAFKNVIGFSARKYKEETFGPKYINTSETFLFKKSKVLFGLGYCRQRIAKERRAIIVEGQFDALSMIYAGINIVVAAQGTAFGSEHIKELVNLGVNHVYLALDSDKAGEQAAIKIGNLFQKEAIEVYVVSLPEGSDPDTMLKEEGPDAWQQLMKSSCDYLTFLVKKMSMTVDMHSPSGKNEIVQNLAKQIREWEHPLMVHESLRKLAKLTQTPESVIGIGKEIAPHVYIKKASSLNSKEVDPDRVLEADLLRWLFIIGENEKKLIEIAKKNLREEHFHIAVCRRLFISYMQAYEEKKPRDLLSLTINLDDTEEQLFLSEMLQKRINKEKAVEKFIDTVRSMLDRHWMMQREEIKMKIHSGKCSDDEAILLAKRFDEIKKERPQVKLED